MIFETQWEKMTEDLVNQGTAGITGNHSYERFRMKPVLDLRRCYPTWFTIQGWDHIRSST